MNGVAWHPLVLESVKIQPHFKGSIFKAEVGDKVNEKTICDSALRATDCLSQRW